MKIKPKNWDDLSPNDKYKITIGKATGVCLCNPSLGENCKWCKDLPDIKEEDRNYHEEAIIIASGLQNESMKNGDAYWMYKNFLELDDPKSFNDNFRHYFIGSNFENGMWAYVKSIRQCDYYEHLSIVNTNFSKDDDDRFVSPGYLDSLLHTFMNTSEVPNNVFKKILKL